MFRPFLYFLVLLVTFGCAKYVPLRPKNDCIPYSNLEYCAIQAANDFRLSFLPDEMTKSTQSLGVKSINCIDLPSSFSDISTRDSVFVINYYDDKGFSLVASSEYTSDVLVSTESGSLDSSKLFNDNAEYDFDGEEIMYKYVESLLYNYENDETNRRIKDPTTKLNPGEGYNTWYTDTLVHPLVHYKWGQKYPFNKSMPATPPSLVSHDSTSVYRGKYAAGCVIIAAMQMVAATNHPSTISPDSYVYYMSQFSGVSMYYNYESFLPDNYDTNVRPQLKLVTNKLAFLIYWFGDSIDAEYKPNGSTGASVDDAMDLLSDLDYARYGNWSKISYSGYNPSLYIALNLGKPAIIRGDRLKINGETVGHAWLIDGYISQHMTRPDDDEYHRYYSHFNWGRNGNSDGYYLYIGESQYQQDATYDTNTDLGTSPTNYSLNTYYYLY